MTKCRREKRCGVTIYLLPTYPSDVPRRPEASSFNEGIRFHIWDILAWSLGIPRVRYFFLGMLDHVSYVHIPWKTESSNLYSLHIYYISIYNQTHARCDSVQEQVQWQFLQVLGDCSFCQPSILSGNQLRNLKRSWKISSLKLTTKALGK